MKEAALRGARNEVPRSRVAWWIFWGTDVMGKVTTVWIDFAKHMSPPQGWQAPAFRHWGLGAVSCTPRKFASQSERNHGNANLALLSARRSPSDAFASAIIGGQTSVARSSSSSSTGTANLSRKNVTAKPSQSPACANSSSRVQASVPTTRGHAGS